MQFCQIGYLSNSFEFLPGGYTFLFRIETLAF